MKRRVTSAISMLLFIGCILAVSLGMRPMRIGASPASTPLLDPTLIAYWKMEESSGTAVIDSSGHGHDLFLANAPADPKLSDDVRTLMGENHSSLALDEVDDYAFAWPLTETVGNSQLTVETWVKFDPLTGLSHSLVSALNNGLAYQWTLRSVAGQLEADIFDTACCSGAPAYGQTTGVDLQPGQWYHVAFVYDGSQATNAQRLRVYVDGTEYPLVYYGTIPATLSNAQPVVRLGPTDEVSPPLNGKLDEVRIYTIARSSMDIADDAGGGTASVYPPPTPTSTPAPVVGDPLAYWKMEGESDGIVVDSSGHGHDLFFANAPADPELSDDVPTLIGGNSSSLALDEVDDYAYAWPLTETVGNSQLTAETWVKFDAPLNVYPYAHSLASALNNGLAYQWTLATHSKEVQVTIFEAPLGSSAPSLGETVGVNLQPGQWYHVAFVYDGSQATNAQRLRIYVDGTEYPLVYYGTIPATLSNAQPVVRLGPTDEVSPPLNGKLDEVRIYTVARSSTDIAKDAAGQTWSTNTAPLIAGDNPSVVKSEGQAATNTGTYSDANVGDDVMMSASIGTVTKTGTNSGTWSWSFSVTDGTAQSQIVTVSADDGDGGTSTTTFSLTVNNIAPTATFANMSGIVIAGESTTLTFSDQFDPSTVDTAAGFRYSYDCTNDGNFELADSTVPSYTCPCPSGGTFVAKGLIKDKDEGSTQYTVTVTVLTPVQAIDVIGGSVQALVDSGALNQGRGSALMNKLEQAIKKLSQGKTDQAIARLQAFINEVDHLVNTGELTPAEGQPLVDMANRVIAALGR